MEYRLLVPTGVRVSSLCMGTVSFGGDADQKGASAMYRRCRDVGIDLPDTAYVYPEGRSDVSRCAPATVHRRECNR
jgi:aryl-alcohol dehydrogenase-like predicted oxidoreductase